MPSATRDREFHIVAGPTAAGALEIGLAVSREQILVHHDLLSCGPLPAVSSLDEWRAVRESYLRSLHIEFPWVSFAEQDRDLLTNRERLRSAQTITLWLGTGLAEQLMLIWVIAALLFCSTVVNYIDRQTLSVLAPHLKTEFGWTNADFAWIVIAFRIAYGGGQMLSGPLLDRMGTRLGLSVTVACYSTVAALTSLAAGLRSFAAFRFLLGAAESANWPGATKAVAEWFHPRQSGWAVAFFDSGSSICGAIAPALVFAMVRLTGSWRPAITTSGTSMSR